MFAPEKLAEWVQDATERTFEIVADLNNEQMMGPNLSIINPFLWEIGHLAWFQSKWALRHAAGQSPVRANEDALYDSMAIAHDDRWSLPLPTRRETCEYILDVRDGVLSRLGDGHLSPEEAYHIFYSVMHADMHTEAFTYTRQTMGYPAPRLRIPRAATELGAGPHPGDAAVPGGTFMLGGGREEPFVFDNEKWAHPVELEPFAIAKAPVTQAEFLAFVEAGGYRHRELWSESGWAWREEEGAAHPVYWKHEPDAGWMRRHFDLWVPLEPHRPVVHVCWYEAEAYCTWAERRLPTEAEWELAASGEPGGEGFSARKRRYPWGDEPPIPERANLDWIGMGCADVAAFPAGDSAFGCRQMLGNVWEWTSSVFGPFPGFEPDPYKDYSEPWFHTRKVLRGGAWATRSRLARSGYRNYFTPERRDVFAGFRTCAVD